MQARCPKCGRMFNVSPRAVDHQVRCPACLKVFHLDPSRTQPEDTIVQWITQDVRQIDAMRKRHQNLVERFG